MAGEPTDETDRTLDEIFEVLADGRRRTVVSYLSGVDGPVDLAVLADRVVEERTDGQSSNDGEEALKTYMNLYHSHIPKMEAAGLVTYVQDEDVVVPSDRLDDVHRYLQAISGDGEPRIDDGV